MSFPTWGKQEYWVPELISEHLGRPTDWEIDEPPELASGRAWHWCWSPPRAQWGLGWDGRTGFQFWNAVRVPKKGGLDSGNPKSIEVGMSEECGTSWGAWNKQQEEMKLKKAARTSLWWRQESIFTGDEQSWWDLS